MYSMLPLYNMEIPLLKTPNMDRSDDSEDPFRNFKGYHQQPMKTSNGYNTMMVDPTSTPKDPQHFGILQDYEQYCAPSPAPSPVIVENKIKRQGEALPPPSLKSFDDILKTNTTKKMTHKKKKKKKSKKNKDTVIDPERCWRQVKGQPIVSIKMKTRRELPSVQVDEHLYSSLKYEFFVNTEDLSPHTCYIMRVNMIYGDNCMEVPADVSRKPLLKGTTETTLSMNDHVHKGYMKIQFSNDLSYHKLKRELRYQVSVYASDALEEGQALATLQSPAFRVYCRKPDTEHTQKRKRSALEQDYMLPNERPIKKMKSNHLNDFATQVQGLFDSIQTLDKQSQNIALEKLVHEIQRCRQE